MNDIEVSSIDLVEGGNVFKQGHYLTLGYVPRDESGATVDLNGKTLKVSLWGYGGIAFESAATFSGGVIRFTLNETVPAGDYQVEFTATSSTDMNYRKKFPTNANAARISVNRSADDAGELGISIYTIEEFEKKQKAITDTFKASVEGKVLELETEFDAAVGAVTVDSEVVIARGSEPTLNQRLQRDREIVDTKIEKGADNLGVSTLDNLRIAFQFWSKDDPAKMRLAKSLGINTVILNKLVSWYYDIPELTRVLDGYNKHGLYVILGTRTDKLTSATPSVVEEELSFIRSIENHPAVVGFYGYDEPMLNSISLANQQKVYDGIKSVTKKLVVISDVPLDATNRNTLIQFYAPGTFDVYVMNTYFTNDSNRTLETYKELIWRAMDYLYNNELGKKPPAYIIPNLPAFSDGKTFMVAPTEQQWKWTIEAWKPFYSGSYAVFAFENDLLPNNILNNKNLQAYVKNTPSLFSSNTGEAMQHFIKGLKAYQQATFVNGILMSDKGRLHIYKTGEMPIKIVPKDELIDSIPMIAVSNPADSAFVIQLRKSGNGTFTSVTSTGPETSTYVGAIGANGGLTIGGGIRIKKLQTATRATTTTVIPPHSILKYTVGIPGVAKGDACIITPVSDLEDGVIPTASVTSPDTVMVKLTNTKDVAVSHINNTMMIDVISR